MDTEEWRRVRRLAFLQIALGYHAENFSSTQRFLVAQNSRDSRTVLRVALCPTQGRGLDSRSVTAKISGVLFTAVQHVQWTSAILFPALEVTCLLSTV